MAKTARIRGRKWMTIRTRIINRDPNCKQCEASGYLSPSTEVDHIVSLKDGGTNDDDNLQGLCSACHQDKTAQDMGHRQRVTIGVDGWPIEGNRRS